MGLVFDIGVEAQPRGGDRSLGLWLVLKRKLHDLAVANQGVERTYGFTPYPYKVHGMMVLLRATSRTRVVGFPMFAYVQMAQHADYSTPLVNLSTAEHVRRAICDIQSSTTRATA